MAQKIFVGGIAFSTSSDGLRQLFEQSGSVVSANVVTDQFSGQSRGFGFVEMASADEAQKAVTQLNGRELDGRRLRVEIAQPKAEGSRGPRSGSGGTRSSWR